MAWGKIRILTFLLKDVIINIRVFDVRCNHYR